MIRKDDNTNFNDDARGMINIAFAYCFQEARLWTTRSSDLEQNNFVVQVSTSMRLITSKNGDSLSCVDKVNETNIDNTSLKQLLNNNYDVAVNKSKIKGQLPLEHIIGFYKNFLKNSKTLGFHLTFN